MPRSFGAAGGTAAWRMVGGQETGERGRQGGGDCLWRGGLRSDLERRVGLDQSENELSLTSVSHTCLLSYSSICLLLQDTPRSRSFLPSSPLSPGSLKGPLLCSLQPVPITVTVNLTANSMTLLVQLPCCPSSPSSHSWNDACPPWGFCSHCLPTRFRSC